MIVWSQGLKNGNWKSEKAPGVIFLGRAACGCHVESYDGMDTWRVTLGSFECPLRHTIGFEFEKVTVKFPAVWL